MPFPGNLDMARSVEAIIRAEGAVPATIAVIDGVLHIGLEEDQLERLAQVTDAMKLSRADLAFAIAAGRTGATTVAATMIAAARAGIKVFATGGIGGVHRKAEETFDISADLEELAKHPGHSRFRRRQGHTRCAQDAGSAGNKGRAGRHIRSGQIPRLLVAIISIGQPAAPGQPKGHRRLPEDARTSRHWRRHADRQPGAGSRRNRQ